MNYLSVCSGIEAASVAWHPLGWRPFAFSEIEKFPSRVLARHYPDTPNFGDMTKFQEWPDATIDVLVGGTPCQSFSVAGLRAGLADPRGNLMLTYLAIAGKYRPEWLVWENVPGVLSSNGGRDFGALLGGLAKLGYGFAYRILDAQYVRVDGLERAVPQRRRRVFVVGCLGGWRRAAAVLFERESLRGNFAPSRKAREGFTSTVGDCLTKCRASSPDEVRGTGNLIPQAPPSIPLLECGRDGSDRRGKRNADPDRGYFGDTYAIQSGALRENPASGPQAIGVQRGVAYTIEARAEVQCVAHSLRAGGFDASEDGTGRGTPLVPAAYSIMPMNSGKDYKARETDVAQPIMASGPTGGNQGGDYIVDPVISFPWQVGGTMQMQVDTERCATLVKNQTHAISSQMGVRRLTPRECERLQGFPDDYTAIPGAADGPRYKALGNSMAVNVMRWIGTRIAMVDSISDAKELSA